MQVHVPYYRELFAQTGFEPGAVQSVADLARLPLLTKAVIRANAETLKADDAAALKRYSTGGLERRATGILHRQGPCEP